MTYYDSLTLYRAKKKLFAVLTKDGLSCEESVKNEKETDQKGEDWKRENFYLSKEQKGRGESGLYVVGSK